MSIWDTITGRRARVSPQQRSVVMQQRCGCFGLRYTVGDPADYIFTIDIYAYMDNAHPERHLGWWRFELPRDAGQASVEMDFDPIRAESMTLLVGGAPVPSQDQWHNPDYAFDPLGDLQLVLRSGSGEIQRMEPVLLKFTDRDILREFYVRQYTSEGYTASTDAPFLHELHDYKLGRLRELFDRYIPAGGRAIDVGCGRSLFTEIDATFPFTVYAGDLNYESVHARAIAVPHQSWAVFDAAAVPFADEQFDALFAGEVIEHVANTEATLREWWRILKPGGVAIITTPNRERLVAVADRLECPYSRDHLRELSYRELTRQLLPAAGFDFAEQSCLYLELWLQNLFNGRRVQDFLQREGNQRKRVPLMRKLFPLGRFVPWWSMAMIVVARKRAA